MRPAPQLPQSDYARSKLRAAAPSAGNAAFAVQALLKRCIVKRTTTLLPLTRSCTAPKFASRALMNAGLHNRGASRDRDCGAAAAKQFAPLDQRRTTQVSHTTTRVSTARPIRSLAVSDHDPSGLGAFAIRSSRAIMNSGNVTLMAMTKPSRM